MPSLRFVAKALAHTDRDTCVEHTVVGVYADGTGRFVRHVAMLAVHSEVTANTEVDVLHMGPPIVAGDESREAAKSGARSIRVSIVGDIALSISERNAMKNWCAKVNKQRRPRLPFQQYLVAPHMAWVRSEQGRKLYQRFSCTGFVIECYREADINLVDTVAELPEVDEQVLRRAYPDIIKIELAEQKVRDRLGFKGRDDLGVPGKGPWQIVLAGYLFHAMNRASEECPRPSPYVPASLADAEFA